MEDGEMGRWLEPREESGLKWERMGWRGAVATRDGDKSKRCEEGEVGFYDHKVWSIILQRTVVKWRKL
ncbi:hypothetical protein [Bartonella sp. AU15XJBT]|uniref:hypothetical protein n=1 Tax=Bartonella sp. AU15XJBT TaxID=3019087 RepID=UPI00235EAB50|nr:hypothetical protein [Bartonella sp. AU15XJBT]